jgi:hypothetical protein
MNKFVTSITAKLRGPREKNPTPMERTPFSEPGGLRRESDSAPASGSPGLYDQHHASTVIAPRLGTVSKKRTPSMFSAEGVARARGFWLVVLLLFNFALWGGLGWIVLHLLR